MRGREEVQRKSKEILRLSIYNNRDENVYFLDFECFMSTDRATIVNELQPEL